MITFKALIEIKRNRRDRNRYRFKTAKERSLKKVEVQMRIMYIRANSMVEAYDTARRVRFSSLKWLTEIEQDAYFRGISKVSDHY